MIQLGSGATSISSTCLPNFAPKNDDTTLPYELVMTAIMMSPGAMYCMYGTPSMRPTRLPIKLPKMTKYSADVTAEGTMVCAQMRMMRPYSRMMMVLKPIQRAWRSDLTVSAARDAAAMSLMMGALLWPVCARPAS